MLVFDSADLDSAVDCAVDAAWFNQGMGAKPVEDAQRSHGKNRVEGIQFTAHNKLLLATSGKRALEGGHVRIPADNQDIKNDLHSLKKTTSSTGAPRFDAEHTENGHADRAWAFCLACHAADELPTVTVQSRGRRATNDLLTGYYT